MSASDCVKVAVRVRPFISSELNRGCLEVLERISSQQLKVTGSANSNNSFSFNNLFMPDEDQDTVYDKSVKPIIDNLFEGYNVTILAYGQTGSGKTFTMGTTFEGTWDSPKTGIIPRALRDIFDKIQSFKHEASPVVTCSFLEIYQENLFDLLSSKPREQSVCEIREDSSKEIVIAGLSEISIPDASKAAKYLMEGGENRSTGATAMNSVSSRSHAIFTVNIRFLDVEGSTIRAKFHLVDLAGSERSKKTKATGARFKEGVKINQGLLALGNVISALGGGSGSGGGYISYRDSKLTRLLQDSLGGNSVTLMIACVSPADYNIEETLSTLRYADRAKKIKNKPVKNQDLQEAEVMRLKETIHSLRVAILTHIQNEVPPGSCGAACKKMKLDKENEKNSLRQEMSKLVTIIGSLHSQHLLEETFYNDLMDSFEKLQDLWNQTRPEDFADPSIHGKISEVSKAMTDLIATHKQQIEESTAEDDFKFDENSFDDEASNQKRLEYTAQQMEALMQIKTLEREMKIKQDLLERKFMNTPFLNDETEKTLKEYESTIKNLEKELSELRSSGNSSAVRRDQNATKVNMSRKHKIDQLEKDLEETRKKCVSLEKTKKLAEQDRKRIEDLKREIQEMKNARVQLIRQQRTDSDRYKKWISSRDKEINILKEKGKKAQNEMKRMERMHDKQQTVLKRKVEEAKAVNKRLQVAMDRGKNAQAMRYISKSVIKQCVIQTYIDHELDILVSTIDAKISMQSLMNDRGLLNERLMNLKSTVNKNESIENEIRQLEEDLEMRNTQIADIRQRIMQTDLDAKIKSIPENFATVPEQKIAMGYIIKALLDARLDFTLTKIKAEDLKIAYEASEERIELINEELLKERESHKIIRSQMESDFENKLSFLLQLNPASIVIDQPLDEIKAPVFISMASQLLHAVEITKELEVRVEELEQELELARNARNKKSRQPRNNLLDNQTYVKDLNSPDLFGSDDSDEFSFNDSFRDPDWRATPASKRRNFSRTTSLMKESVINRMDATGILANITESSDVSGHKRTSNGTVKCKCKGSCATKQCGCKKLDICCSIYCGCSDACVNDLDESKESDKDDDQQNEREKENSPERKHIKVDMSNVATPYYPYEAKKRKPLLNI